MNSSSSRSNNEALDEASKWLVGGGMLTLALAPLALPGLVLAAVLALPLLLLALPVAAIVGALMLLRAIGRRLLRPTPCEPGEQALHGQSRVQERWTDARELVGS
jgi:membrane protein implicated in regulation of membrane protease activity